MFVSIRRNSTGIDWFVPVEKNRPASRREVSSGVCLAGSRQDPVRYRPRGSDRTNSTLSPDLPKTWTVTPGCDAWLTESYAFVEPNRE